ncbi:uncharacterized protein EAF01_011933 [Botrytis porri]|uniref:2EXR domain-containing protein n=1 Tax=Botrytis porri TaxID=87229 RepID=A0A4Z1KD18_9HELO|nr:uncharacterized protein EAF01_011933 [Botrytis porri]KAF7880768.1 hypothetical protein EAF01_011933 [Botrytis porri]TGO83987.1 hypothetical protein BPOR_0566g00080 [Botrytis porri]
MASLTQTLSESDIHSTLSLMSPFSSLHASRTPEQSFLPESQNTFHKFSLLPRTIRCMIWRQAFLETQHPRLIEVRAESVENLQWNIDCEKTIFPEPTGSSVLRWTEVNPRSQCTIEIVSRESRDVVEGMWDYCLNDKHPEDFDFIEDFIGEDGMEDPIYVDRKVVEERLGAGFRRGIKFLRDQDTIYFKTDYGTMRALQDVRSSMVDFQKVRKVAIDIFCIGHYLLNKQLFEGWCEEDDCIEIEHVQEKPLLAEIEELTIVMRSIPPQSKSFSETRSNLPQFEEQQATVTRDESTVTDETLTKDMVSAMEHLARNKMMRNGNIKVDLVKKKHLVANTGE